MKARKEENYLPDVSFFLDDPVRMKQVLDGWWLRDTLENRALVISMVTELYKYHKPKYSARDKKRFKAYLKATEEGKPNPLVPRHNK